MKTTKTPTLKKGGFCTDIHLGRKANSPIHNEDCIRFIDWFCANVIENGCDYVAFLGDWHESRSSLDVSTLNYSYTAARKLNDLGMPVFFVVGNHDLYHRHTREVYSTIPFNEFSNFVVIDKPTVVTEIKGGALFSPYLFHEEYPNLAEYNKIPFWAGHFEFQGFYVTGQNMTMKSGPNHNDFSGPKHILSGHFHKRQQNGNVTYIGNCFPMDFGDAGDTDRGMAIFDHSKTDLQFINWEDCPKYVKVPLSKFADQGTKSIPDNTYFKCVIDIPTTYEDITDLQEQLKKVTGLREFAFEESVDLDQALEESNSEITEQDFGSVDEFVIKMLSSIDTDKIKPTLLTTIYETLR